MKIILLYLSAIALSTCCCKPAAYQELQLQQNGNSIAMILHGNYVIKTLNDVDISTFNLNIAFDENSNKVSGFSGCNRFFGSFSLVENKLKFSDLGATKMLCSEDKNTFETKFLKALNKANSILFLEHGFTLFNKKKPVLSATKLKTEKKLSFEYSASSRGTFKRIIINKDSISFSKKKGKKTIKIYCEPDYWNAIIKISDSIEIKNISNLKAPSKSFQFDGAPLARLKIISNEKTYVSAPFDHGNPPKEIEALVKEILSSIENIE